MTAATQQLKTFAEATAILRNALPGYEERPQQVALAEAIEKIMSAKWDEESDELPPAVAGQAGCGTGKSFALSIPAALCDGRVVIATGTIALQQQIIKKDLPFLEEHLPNFPKYALLMGRGNYLCGAKLAEPTLDLPQLTALQEAMADEDHEGTRDALDGVEISAEQWRLVSSTGTECPGASSCPFSDKCKAEKAKKVAAEAKIVVTNYAMLGLDMVLREKSETTAGPMLGDYGALFCDEADSMDHAIRNALAAKLTQRGLMMLATGAETFVKNHGEMDGEQLKEAVAVNQALWGLSTVLPKTEDEDKPNADPEGGKLRLAWFGENADEVMALISALQGLSAVLRRVSEDGFGPKEKNRKRMLVNQADNAVEALQDAILAQDGEMARFVTWNRAKSASGHGEDFFTVEFHPVLIADRLRESLWSRQRTVCVSATLTTAPGDFSYFTRTLGLEHAELIDVGTPFDYPSQAMLFVPDPSVPAPSQREAWMAYSITKSHELVRYAKGRSLLLYTSRKAMMEAHAVLASRFEKLGLEVLVQDGQTPNSELAARFRNNDKSVLFGLKSFFVGLDVPGIYLVIIDKLPFPVPTEPIFEARSEAEQAAGRNPFASLSVPMMTLDLTQAFGRLIRRKQDRGLVAILDSRLSSKAYGKKIIDGLPNCPVEVEEDKVEAFFAAMAN